MSQSAQQSTSQQKRAPTKRARKDVFLLDQANATAVWRVLDRAEPIPTAELAHDIGIAQSAISEWRNPKSGRQVTFERLGDLARVYDVDWMIFLIPVAKVEKEINSIMQARRREIREALNRLTTDRKRGKAGENHQISMDFDAKSGRHLRTVPAR